MSFSSIPEIICKSKSIYKKKLESRRFICCRRIPRDALDRVRSESRLESWRVQITFRLPLPVLHLTLLALHHWTLDATLVLCARRRAHIPSNHWVQYSFPSKSQLAHSHHHLNCFSMSTQLTLLLSCQKDNSKLIPMQLERLGAHLNIFFLLATSIENEEYALTRKGSKSSKLVIEASHWSWEFSRKSFFAAIAKIND